MVRQVFSQIALKDSDFPRRVTIEERNWFQNFLGLKLDDLTYVLSQIENYFEEFLNAYLPKLGWQNLRTIEHYLTDGRLVLLSREEASGYEHF
ncbi:MAG: hypothetical protein IPJ40_24370 [Saprospirales bacterium]|nr:hypothetical protein [Saprospirales bacterium]